MLLANLLNLPSVPIPWSGENIPWHEPGFSERMLAEHLSQAHDLGSRGLQHIERAVAWVHDEVLGGVPSKILDLGCGPGLYLRAFAERGHSGVGIDISPASVRHAQELLRGSSVEVIEGDWRTTPFGEDFDLVTLLFSEMNGFRREVALDILARAEKAGRRLVMEVQTLDGMLNCDYPGKEWELVQSGPLCAEPYLLLTEHFFDDESLVVTTRFIVVQLSSGVSSVHVHTEQGYRDDEWHELLTEAGWRNVTQGPPLGAAAEKRFMTLTAVR